MNRTKLLKEVARAKANVAQQLLKVKNVKYLCNVRIKGNRIFANVTGIKDYSAFGSEYYNLQVDCSGNDEFFAIVQTTQHNSWVIKKGTLKDVLKTWNQLCDKQLKSLKRYAKDISDCRVSER